MAKRKTHDCYIEDLRNVNPHLHILNRYTNSRTKIKIHDDRCNHTWEVIPSTPLRGIGCPKCAGKYKRTYQDFLDDLKLINSNIKILTSEDKYVNGSKNVFCECMIDGHKWYALPTALLKGHGCPKCYGYISDKEFKELLHKKFSNIVLVGKYLGSKTKTKFKCLIDENIWESIPYQLLHSVYGCPKCANRKQSERQTLLHDEYIRRLKNITNSIIPKEQYIRTEVPILHRCVKCDHEWIISPNSLITERSVCPKCNCSKGESRVIKFLEDNNISFVFQKKFNDLKYINFLFYDFYIPEFNTIIEYDGEFHYIDIFKNGTLEDVKIRDNLKNEYAKKNNINIIRIPYWDFNNIETILRTQLIG